MTARVIPVEDRPGCRWPGCEARAAGEIGLRFERDGEHVEKRVPLCLPHRDQLLGLSDLSRQLPRDVNDWLDREAGISGDRIWVQARRNQA